MSEFKPKPYHPKWRYHKTQKPQLVQSAAHEKALGEEWKDSPAHFGVVTHPLSEEQQAVQDAEKHEVHEDHEEEAPEAPKVKKPKKG